MMNLLGGVVGLALGFLGGLFLFLLWHRTPRQVARSHDSSLRLLGRRLAHEIRNPLNAMNLHVQLLEEELAGSEGVPSSAQRRLQRLQHEIKRLDRILTDYQRYARLPDPEPVASDLKALLEDLIDFIEPEAQHQNITVKRAFEDLPPVEVDVPQFRQALLNLILNANQAMPEGGELTVRAYPEGSHLRIDIRDTGAGIPEEIQDRIFEPFYSTKEEGTGIGLPMAKHVIEAHGGSLSFQSRPGEGTTFSIQLPLRAEE